MGQVSNALPTILSQVTALGTGTKLTDYYNGGAGGIGNTAGEAGFIPTSGTIELTDFKDATRVNCRGNIFYNVYAQGELSTEKANAMITFLSNGSIQFHGNGVEDTATTISGNVSTVSNNYTISYDREWLYLNSTPCLTNTTNNWQIKLTKTGGTFAAPTSNNTWIAFPHQVICQAIQSGVGTNSQSISCNVQIRRADTLGVVHNGVLRLEVVAHRIFGG